MSKVYPFKALRPNTKVLNNFTVSFAESEAREELLERIKHFPENFLQIHKPHLIAGGEMSANEILKASKNSLKKYMDEGVLLEDPKPCIYIYMQINGSHTYTGIIALASIDEYKEGKIKKHELTRIEKENKMLDYFERVHINGSPVLLTYPDDASIDTLISSLTRGKPEFNYTSNDEIEHILWRVCEPENIEALAKHYAKIKNLYIADGHHRCAAYSRLQKPGEGFMAYLVPAGQLNIYGFHRLITDLDGLKRKKVLHELKEKFLVKKVEGEFAPSAPGVIYMFMKKKWYSITIPEALKKHKNTRENLDVSILDTYILHDILKIQDSRSSTKIQYVNGNTPLERLAEAVLSKRARIAFALYPVHMSDVIKVSDEGMTMPPKSTWIEPKMRIGLVIQKW